MDEIQMILQDLQRRMKMRLGTTGVPSSEYIAYFNYVNEGLSRGFSEELREKYIKRGCDPGILKALRDMAEPLKGELIRIRLRRMREKLSYLRRHTY